MNVPPSRIIEELRSFVKKHKTQALAAKALKVTPSVLSLTLSKQTNVIPEKILRKLGYRSETAYFKTGKVKAAAEEPAQEEPKAVEPKTKAALVRTVKTAEPKATAAREPRQAPRPVVIPKNAQAEHNTEPAVISIRD